MNKLEQTISVKTRKVVTSRTFIIICLKRVLITVLLLVSYNANSRVITEPILSKNLCSGIIPYKGVAFFCLDHALYGKELHHSDGSRTGTKILKDIDPGKGSSTPFVFFEFEENLYFLAETTLTGYALWRTNGTEKGTKLIRSIASSTDFRTSYGGFIGTVSGNAFFFAGSKLYKTDGTYAGTRRINVELASVRTYHIKDDMLYVIAVDGGQKVLTSITGSGHINSIKKFPHSTYVSLKDYQFQNNLILEVRSCDSPDKYASCELEYWFSNGYSSSGTRFYKSRREIEILGVLADRLVFLDRSESDDETHAANLKLTQDGINEILVTTVNPASGGQLNPTLIDGKLWFGEYFSNATYITDGTEGGTHLIPIRHHSHIVFNEAIIGLCTENTSYLCSSNINGSVVTLLNTKGVSYFFPRKSPIGIYYSNFDDHSIWLTNGQAGSSRKIYSHERETSRSLNLHGTEGHRLFYSVANDIASSDYDRQIWHSDGTKSGTYKLLYQYDVPTPTPPTPEEQRLTATMVAIRMLLLDDNKP